MKIISVKELEDVKKIEELCKDSKGPLFVEQGGDIKFVIFDFDYYNALISKLNEAKLVNKGLEDLQTGKVVNGKEVSDKIKKKF